MVSVSRPAVVTCLALLAVAAFAGCVDGADQGQGEAEPEPPEEEAGALSGTASEAEDLAGLPPGVARGPAETAEGSAEGTDAPAAEEIFASGGVEGVVYEYTTGTPLEGADVVVRCKDETVLGARATATSDGEGRFSLPAVAALAECDEVRYEVHLAGYHMRLPLTSGPMSADALYMVHAAMDADVET